LDSRRHARRFNYHHFESPLMRIGIIGGGESGVGAALLSKKEGLEPFVSDYGYINPVYRQILIENNVHFEESGHNFDTLSKSDVIVKSPGVRETTPIIESLTNHGLSIISELEFGFRFCKGKIIAITGSNGKTTTTNLTHHILERSDYTVVKGGNLGTCLCSLLLKHPVDIYVLEVSSFQLDGINTFHPDVSILTNITPDHLDRYKYNFDDYADSKMRISLNQTEQDKFIYNAEDSATTKRLARVKAQQVAVRSVDVDAMMSTISNHGLLGRHNAFNASCAVEAVKAIGYNNPEAIDVAFCIRSYGCTRDMDCRRCG